MNKIFISIPSLRDPTLEATMKIALKNADNPKNVIFGVGAQYYDDEMPEFNFINKDQLKLLKINPDHRPGVVKLRYEISKLITDESYFMSIDSHMLFSPHWDTKCLAWIKELQEKIGNQKVCVTNGRIIADNTQSDHQVICRISSKNTIDDGGLLKAKSFKDGWLEAVNICCNFFFAPIEIIKDVGWDPYSQFTWEEQYMFFRVFMSGFECFIPTEDAVVKQSPDFYYHYVWPDMSKHYFTRLENQDPTNQKLELQRAMTTNEKSNKFSIENSTKHVREFWDRLGQGELFDKYQTG